MENYKCKSVGVIGSGIQGVCTGLQLIKKGIPVTIFDRHDPLSFEFKPASYGNAGHFSPYAVLQFNRPDVLNDVPKMIQSYNINQLTHIVGYTQNIENYYKIGQVLEFEFKGILPLREAVDLSERKGDTWRVLNVDYLQNTKLKV